MRIKYIHHQINPLCSSNIYPDTIDAGHAWLYQFDKAVFRRLIYISFESILL